MQPAHIPSRTCTLRVRENYTLSNALIRRPGLQPRHSDATVQIPLKSGRSAWSTRNVQNELN